MLLVSSTRWRDQIEMTMLLFTGIILILSIIVRVSATLYGNRRFRKFYANPNRSQYHKMNDLTWEDYGEKYDLKSIMHYEGWAFAKVGFQFF